ncbi:uncharacterized protein LOC124666748 [Lolium rigidum]|uniref:uncharacterized protein LOC124666748 n=1 Tax=Lolium rigidum TaxID=89674 RepID=UPI001F5DD82A|nr:uncharacterized protein LOC124666748 [Lolium rigidum]
MVAQVEYASEGIATELLLYLMLLPPAERRSEVDAADNIGATVRRINARFFVSLLVLGRSFLLLYLVSWLCEIWKIEIYEWFQEMDLLLDHVEVFNPICEICSRTWLEYLKMERNYQYCLSCCRGVRSLVIVPFELNHREIEALHVFIVPILVETIDEAYPVVHL